LRDADPKWLRSQFSVVMQWTVLELRGFPCLELEDGTPDRKTIMASRSFGRPVETYEDMQEAVATYVSRTAEIMRRQNLVTPALQVFVNTSRFRIEDALHQAREVQAGLFHAPDPPVRLELMASLDSLNHRYGRGTVAFAASGIRKAWKLRSE